MKEAWGCEGERTAVLTEGVKDIFAGPRPSWCLCWTAAGVRSLFQPWRQLEVSTPRQPQLYIPTKLGHVFVHTAALLSQQADDKGSHPTFRTTCKTLWIFNDLIYFSSHRKMCIFKIVKWTI